MMPKLYDAIEQAVANGVPVNLIGDALVRQGWPPELVRQALEAWLKTYGRQTKTTAFKDWVARYRKKARGAVVLVVFIGTIQAGVALMKPWPTKILADSAFGRIPAPGPLAPYTHTPTLILLTSLMTIGLFIIGSTFDFFSSFLLLKVGFWLNRSIKIESLRHILHLPLFHQERLAKGDYVYRQNVVTNSLSDLVLGTTSSIIGSILMIIGVLIIMLKFNPKLTLVSVVLMPLLYLTMRIFGPKMGKYSRALTEVASETSSRINESIDNAETVQAYTLEDKQLANVDKLWQRGYFLTKRSMLWGNLLSNTNGFLTILATSTVMYFGGTAALQGKMTFGQLLIFMTYMGYLLGPIENLVKQITSRNQKLIDVNRIYEVLSDHEGVEDLRKDNHIPPTIRGILDFQNVSYSYNHQVIFQNLNLHINQGEKIGIIGPSGAGKSTILKLIALFIEPASGRILMDGIDIQSVSLKELRQRIAWVSQNPQLFSGTILDNLLDGDPYRSISNEEISNAVFVSNVAEFALKLPLGITSPAGENGSSLSGGQKQRIAIARSLIKNAPILCLDEPTAALDVKSENYIRDSLSKMIQGKTTVMVTHRKALLSLMDTIYVLDSGTLKDVKELGGLDYYLGVLEGIDQEKAKKDMELDKLNVDRLAMDKFMTYLAAHKQEEAQAKPINMPVSTLNVPIVNEDGEVEIRLH
ncbi:MAG: putative Xenobiotic-transporting ATPase [Candidatus Saccharibacteria bacterium]|nr:putative Xenobiotic-transporting ATPase [Candidatus Saccharibacteria bacterium]